MRLGCTACGPHVEPTRLASLAANAGSILPCPGGKLLHQAGLPALIHTKHSPLCAVRAIELHAGTGDLLAALQAGGASADQ